VTDLALLAEALADVELCLGHCGLFDEGELMQVHVIAARLRRGILLGPEPRELLARCAARVRQSSSRHGVPE